MTRRNQFFRQAQSISSDNIILLLCSTRNVPGVFCERIKIRKGGSFQTSCKYDGDCDLRGFLVFPPELPSMGLSHSSCRGPFHKPIMWSFQPVFLHFADLGVFFIFFLCPLVLIFSTFTREEQVSGSE